MPEVVPDLSEAEGRAKWLRQVEAQNWVVQARDGDALVLQCPAVGCQARMRLKMGAVPPRVDPCASRSAWDVPIYDPVQLRRDLRDRRHQLGFTLEEVDQAAGWPSERYAQKLESMERVREPTVATLITWAAVLGYEMVLRPTPLPAASRRIMANKLAPEG